MCIFVSPATASATKLYIGKGRRDGREVHVLGYQNKVASEAGPNCMILHFPASEPMTEANVMDMSDCPSVMDDIDRSVVTGPAVAAGGMSRSLGLDSVEVFDHDIYTVFLAQRADAIVPALESHLSEDERPEVSDDLLGWYEDNYPDHNFALCVFDGSEAAEADPMFWWYVPSTPSELMAPAVDSHDGSPPDNVDVEVDHAVYVGHAYPDDGTAYEVHYSEDIPDDLEGLLPKRADGWDLDGDYPNGDFVIPAEALDPDSGWDGEYERRFP